MKPNFHVCRVGKGRGTITIITRRAANWGSLPDLRGAIEEETRQEFATFLLSESGIAFLESLPTTTRHRIRVAAGIADEYTGDSRVTQWRKSKAEGGSDESS